tara:strand:- start:1391 stop:1660 length:270 start_codon:yes stop_codon:yes gene_type:complete
MPKKRRKLNQDMEKQIASAKKNVELITAQINDIRDEDIQSEYRQAFQKIQIEVTAVFEYYKTSCYTDDSKNMLNNYDIYLKKFLSEYEL